MDTPNEYAASLRRAEELNKRAKKLYKDISMDEDFWELKDPLFRLVKKYGWPAIHKQILKELDNV